MNDQRTLADFWLAQLSVVRMLGEASRLFVGQSPSPKTLGEVRQGDILQMRSGFSFAFQPHTSLCLSLHFSHQVQEVLSAQLEMPTLSHGDG